MSETDEKIASIANLDTLGDFNENEKLIIQILLINKARKGIFFRLIHVDSVDPLLAEQYFEKDRKFKQTLELDKGFDEILKSISLKLGISESRYEELDELVSTSEINW